MRLFDLIKRKLFREPSRFGDCVIDKEWLVRKYEKEINTDMKWDENGKKRSEGTLKDGKNDGLWYKNIEDEMNTFKSWLNSRGVKFYG